MKIIKKFSKKDDGTLDTNHPILVHFNIKKKITYYEKRSKNRNLTKNQREYAAKKLEMLKTNIGRIYITDDSHFKGKLKSIRRVVFIGKDKNKIGVNRITSSKKTANHENIKLNRKNVPILQKESYLDPEIYVKKKHGDLLKESDLIPTTSTVNPNQISKIKTIIFRSRSKTTSKNRKLFKKK